MAIESLLSSLAILFGIAYSEEHVATFTERGVVGTVKINNQKLSINLDVSKANETTLPAACFANGLSYHMHYWEPSIGFKTTEAFGSTCGFNNTKNHVDPFHACGGASNSAFCAASKTDANPSNPKCIPRTVYGSKCPASPKPGSYGCEVGDWSNKYGTLKFTSKVGSMVGTSSFEIDNAFFSRTGAPTYSIVFHCTNGGKRIFCAKFEKVTQTASLPLPTQTSTIESVQADFSGVLAAGTYVRMNKTGEVEVMLDSTGKDLTSVEVADCKTTGYHIAIYDGKLTGKTSALGADCKGIGKQWDPTVTCFGAYSSSSYCTGSKLCGQANGYTCSTAKDMWDCSPSDISTRGGVVFKPGTKLSNADLYTKATKTAGLPPLSDLIGKSIAIYCPDKSARGMDKSILACANIMETGGSTMKTTMMSKTTTMMSKTTQAPQDNAAVNYFTIFAIINAFIVALFC